MTSTLTFLFVSTIVLMVGSEAFSPPIIVSKGGHRIVSEGDDIEFECIVQNIGDYTQSWTFNNKTKISVPIVLIAGQYEFSPRERTSFDYQSGTLKIHNARAKDSGDYTCSLSNVPTTKIVYSLRVIKQSLHKWYPSLTQAVFYALSSTVIEMMLEISLFIPY